MSNPRRFGAFGGDPRLTYNDKFFDGYVSAALWSSTDYDTDTPLDRLDPPIPITPETLAAMRADCDKFISDNSSDLDLDAIAPDNAGHDFWLTRNRHGAGFWDGDYPDDIGERLTVASHAFGECYLYVTDDREGIELA